MINYRTTECRCPNCNAVLNTASELSDLDEARGPKIGDFSVCMRCAEIVRFGPSMTLYQPSGDELRELPRETLDTVMKAKLMVTMLLKGRKK